MHARALQDYLMLLDEGYGTAYERYALNRFLQKLIKRFKIKSVLEIPANGVMGVPGIKSLIFAKNGCDVTLVNPSAKTMADIRRVWSALDLKAEFVVADYYSTQLPSKSYDMVWNFCVFEHLKDHFKLIQEMTRLTKKYVLVETQNIFNIGTPIHSLYHTLMRQPWDHGMRNKMNYQAVREDIIKNKLSIVEIDATDMPPWPDINMKLSEIRSKERIESDIEYRPSVQPKAIDEIIDIWSVAPPKDKTVDLFKLWYMLETNIPRFVRLLYAHHPYIIARK